MLSLLPFFSAINHVRASPFPLALRSAVPGMFAGHYKLPVESNPSRHVEHHRKGITVVTLLARQATPCVVEEFTRPCCTEHHTIRSSRGTRSSIGVFVPRTIIGASYRNEKKGKKRRNWDERCLQLQSFTLAIEFISHSIKQDWYDCFLSRFCLL